SLSRLTSSLFMSMHLPSLRRPCRSSSTTLFFSNAPSAPEIYTLSLHDALPILGAHTVRCGASPPSSLLSGVPVGVGRTDHFHERDRKSTRLNSSHVSISYAVFCLKKKRSKRRSERARELRCAGTARRAHRPHRR